MHFQLLKRNFGRKPFSIAKCIPSHFYNVPYTIPQASPTRPLPTPPPPFPTALYIDSFSSNSRSRLPYQFIVQYVLIRKIQNSMNFISQTCVLIVLKHECWVVLFMNNIIFDRFSGSLGTMTRCKNLQITVFLQLLRTTFTYTQKGCSKSKVNSNINSVNRII